MSKGLDCDGRSRSALRSSDSWTIGTKGAFFLPLLQCFNAIQYNRDIPELKHKKKEEKMWLRRGRVGGGDGGELMTGKL